MVLRKTYQLDRFPPPDHDHITRAAFKRDLDFMFELLFSRYDLDMKFDIKFSGSTYNLHGKSEDVFAFQKLDKEIHRFQTQIIEARFDPHRLFLTSKELRKLWDRDLRDPRWKEIRSRIVERDDYTCLHCGRQMQPFVSLNVHHKGYQNGKRPWEYPPEKLTTMCSQCHFWIHKGYKEYRKGRGKRMAQ